MKRVAILFFLLVPALIFAQNFELTSVHLTVQNGLAGDNVYCAMQDDKGYIWFGTETGVSRYNGRTFENFYMSDGLGDNEIFRIDQDSQGRIWFSAFNGKLSFYKDGRFYNDTNSELIRKVSLKRHFMDLFEDAQKNIWLSTRMEIAMIGANGKVKNHADFKLGKKVRIGSFIEREGQVWGLSMNSGHQYHLSHVSDSTVSRLPDVMERDTKKMIPAKKVFLSPAKPILVNNYMKAHTNDSWQP